VSSRGIPGAFSACLASVIAPTEISPRTHSNIRAVGWHGNVISMAALLLCDSQAMSSGGQIHHCRERPRRRRRRQRQMSGSDVRTGARHE